jgi:hypothetical protein
MATTEILPRRVADVSPAAKRTFLALIAFMAVVKVLFTALSVKGDRRLAGRGLLLVVRRGGRARKLSSGRMEDGPKTSGFGAFRRPAAWIGTGRQSGRVSPKI